MLYLFNVYQNVVYSLKGKETELKLVLGPGNDHFIIQGLHSPITGKYLFYFHMPKKVIALPRARII